MMTAVVLAAGRGERLGGVAKALLKDRGETFLARISAACDAVSVLAPVIVLGPPHQHAIAPVAEALGFHIATNPSPQRGMSSSIEIGFAALDGRPELAAFLWPVDTPAVGVATLERLVAAASPTRIVIPTFNGRGGHPALVGREVWADLCRATSAKEGARSVFRARQDQVLRLEVDDAEVLGDVDAPADLARLRERD